MHDTLLKNIVDGHIDGPYALIGRRSSKNDPTRVEVLCGPSRAYARLEDLPSGNRIDSAGVSKENMLVLVPYRQISKVGFDCNDDKETLQAIEIQQHETMSVPEALALLPQEAIRLDGLGFDISDEEYAANARMLISEEIGRGEGSNFVLARSLTAKIDHFSPAHALSIFGELLAKETGSYWTFLIHISGRTFIGASPEQQITLSRGTATMNPISGTYRYPPAGPQIEQVLEFLRDEKETDELFMVADEELKMFGRFCATGGRLKGPFLKEMSRLAHTEYYIEGETSASASTLLKSTLPAPTVTGSPIKNACRVIAKYETRGRGYYAGVAALIGCESDGSEKLDSAILIRTADITDDGQLRIAVGSTIVRHSEPVKEAAETSAKANGLLNAFTGARRVRLEDDVRVKEALNDRNKCVADFWLSGSKVAAISHLSRKKVLVLDADDDFTQMLAQQLKALGLDPVVIPAADPTAVTDGYDMVLLGPGPGSPLDEDDERVLSIRRTLQWCLAMRTPFLAVCLSHQIFCSQLGLKVEPLARPNQGRQREIDFFGSRAIVGFYNTFAAKSPQSTLSDRGELINVCRDLNTLEVHALRGEHFTSMQFHPESVLSIDGLTILNDEIARISNIAEIQLQRRRVS